MSIASAFRSLAELAAKKAPYDDALALAQKHAAMPVSRGGLGLPAGNTAMERARAMNYRDIYHGTSSADDFSQFSTPDVYTTPSAVEAGGYAMGHHLGGEGVAPRVMPLMGRNTDNSLRIDNLIENAINEGDDVGDAVEQGIGQALGQNKRYATFSHPDVVGSDEHDAIISLYPRSGDLRSRFAAFDPFRRNESDLLAGIAPYALPAAGAAGLAGVGAGALMAPVDSEAGIAGPLAKTADLAALKIAQKADAAGLPMAKVYDATGWAKGADGKWRWEFDDSGAGLAHNANMLDRINKRGESFVLDDLGNTLTHPKLYGAYPDAEGVQVQHNLGGVPSGGAYNQASDRITLEGSVLGHATGEAKSTLLHENQHAIQQREGFAQGGNPQNIPISDMALDPRMEILARNIERKEKLASQLGLTPQEMWKKSDAVGLPVQGYDEAVSSLNIAKGIASQDAYRRLAGEVEARNVQSRMGMTPDDRRMRPFWQTEDVPRSQQIVQGQSGQSAYAQMMDLKRAANARSRTHAAPRVPGAAEMAGRAVLQEVVNPINWLGIRMSALAYPRELGDPQALNYSDPYYSYSGSRR